MKAHAPYRLFCILLLTIPVLVPWSAKAQVLYSKLHLQWDGQLDSSDDVLIHAQANGIATCLYSISAGQNANASIYASDRGISGVGPGTPVFEPVVDGVNSNSGSGSFAVTSNHWYELEAYVGYSGSGINGGGNAVCDFFIPSSYLGALPAPWRDGDIGAVAVPGSGGCDTNNNWTIQASGSGITNQADSFHFLYQSLTGDGQIIAQVTGIQYTSPFAEAGVMVRETLAANSSYAFMAFTASALDTFGWRAGTGESSVQTNLPDSAVWLKLVRSGNTLTGYCSTNGVTWIKSGCVLITMQTTVLIGLASTANNNTTLNTATFNQVQFSPNLAFTLSGNSLQFNWPTNFILQSTTNLIASNSWNNVSVTPTVSNDQYIITINTTNGSQFFRLKSNP